MATFQGKTATELEQLSAADWAVLIKDNLPNVVTIEDAAIKAVVKRRLGEIQMGLGPYGRLSLGNSSLDMTDLRANQPRPPTMDRLVESFSAKETEDWVRWRRLFEEALSMANLDTAPEKTRIFYLQRFLTGNAATAGEALAQRIPALKTLGEYLDELGSRFKAAGSSEQAFISLTNRKQQPKETIAEYMVCMVNLVRKTDTKDDMQDRILLPFFLEGINAEVAKALRRKDGYEKWNRFELQRQAEAESERQKQESSRGVTSSIVVRAQREANERDRRRRYQRGWKRASGRSTRADHVDWTTAQMDTARRDKLCFRCLRHGHFAKRCPEAKN